MRGRLRKGVRPGRAGEVAEAKPQDDGPADASRLAHAAGDAVDEPEQGERRPPRESASSGRARAASRSSRGGGRPALAAGRGCGRARGGAAPTPGRAVATSAGQRYLRHLADGRGSRASRSLRGRHLADAPEPLHRQRVEELELAVGRDDEQAVRLRDGARDLREELRPRHADGDPQPDALEDGPAQPNGDLGGRAGEPLEPAHVEERLVDRDALDERRRVLEHLEHRLAGLGVGREARADDHGLRAQPAGARAAHRGADPVRLRLVARRQHDAPADDDRAAAQPRIVTLLDRREERVEVGVEDPPFS